MFNGIQNFFVLDIYTQIILFIASLLSSIITTIMLNELVKFLIKKAKDSKIKNNDLN